MVKSGIFPLFLSIIKAMAGLVGEYEVKMDAKGRIKFSTLCKKW